MIDNPKDYISSWTISVVAVFLSFTVLLPVWSQTSSQNILERMTLTLREESRWTSSLEFHGSIITLVMKKQEPCFGSVAKIRSVTADVSVLNFSDAQIIPSERLSVDMVKIPFRDGYGDVEHDLGVMLLEMLNNTRADTTEQAIRRANLRSAFVVKFLDATDTPSFYETELCDGRLSVEPLGSTGVTFLVGLGKGDTFVDLLNQYANDLDFD